tara:strand:- start:45 stop:1511 length:1467 start_codon:yes stop_codon:yes gene_type:complete
MSTTTTIYTSKDTWLDGENTTTNYGTTTTLKIGQQTVGFGSAGERANAILAFDVSGLTDTRTLTQVNLKLTLNNSTGNTTRTMNVYRLNQDFTEAEATWQISATGTDWSGGTTVGGASNTATTESTATFATGFRDSADVSVDITNMVKDAINLRSGTLLLWIGLPLSDVATTRAMGVYHSLDATTASDRPQLEVITADRIVWDGSAGDGNTNTASNWVGDVVPDEYDHAIFNDGSANVFYASGNLTCNSLFISKGYTGTIQKENGDAFPLTTVATVGHPTTNKISIDQSEGRFNFQLITTNDWSINIASTPTEGGKLYSLYTDKYSTTVIGASNTLELDGDFDIVATGTKTGTKHITTSGTATSIKALNTKLTVTNGCKDFILGDGTKMTCTSGNIAQTGFSYITDKTLVKHLGLETGADINVYNGTLSFKGNENASITTEDIYLWKNGLFDPRTNVGAWNNTASPSIDCRGGGRFLVDVGRTITVTN